MRRNRGAVLGAGVASLALVGSAAVTPAVAAQEPTAVSHSPSAYAFKAEWGIKTGEVPYVEDDQEAQVTDIPGEKQLQVGQLTAAAHPGEASAAAEDVTVYGTSTPRPLIHVDEVTATCEDADASSSVDNLTIAGHKITVDEETGQVQLPKQLKNIVEVEFDDSGQYEDGPGYAEALDIFIRAGEEEHPDYRHLADLSGQLFRIGDVQCDTTDDS